MMSYTVSSFWNTFEKIPDFIQKVAKKKYQIWRDNPFHPSLYFKCVKSKENIWSIRITRDYRALGVKYDNYIIWYWIGNHKNYEKLIK